MKLALLIGGSDAPGLNAVIRAVVRTAVVRYGDDVVGVSQGFQGLLRPPEIWPLGTSDVRGLARRGGTILGAYNRGSPFDAGGRDRSDEVLESMRWLGIDALLVVGGDGSLSIAEKLSRQGVPIVAIPKTIENDIPETGVTFGFATAVEIATDAIDKLQTSREIEHRVMYLEVVGRRAGWIALSAGIAGGADVILIPEVPYDPAAVAAVIRERMAEGKVSTIVVVAEGARPRGAEPVPGQPTAVDVAARVRAVVPCDDRITVLGHLQRGGAPTPQDRILATRFGSAAVQAVHDGVTGHMVGMRGSKIVRVPLAQAVGSLKSVDPAGELVWTALSVGTSLGVPAADLEPKAVPTFAPTT